MELLASVSPQWKVIQVFGENFIHCLCLSDKVTVEKDFFDEWHMKESEGLDILDIVAYKG